LIFRRNGVGPCGIVSTTRAISSRWKEKQKCSNLMLIKIKKSEIKTIFTLTSLVLFKNGKEIARNVGLSPKEKHETFVNNVLNV